MQLIKMLAIALGLSLFMAMPVLAQGPGAAPPAVAAQPAPTQPAPRSPTAAPSAATPAPAAPVATSAGPQPGAPAAPATPGASPQPAAAVAGQPAAPAAGGQPGATAAGPPMDGSTYAVRLRDLEQRIDELKEQIRRSHTRLSLLSDTILSGGGAGSRATIKFNNELSSAFLVTRLLVVFDGAVVYNKTDQSGSVFAEQTEIPFFNGSVPPGDHTLQVLIALQGNGFGVFSYLRSFRFELRSSHSFTAVEGKTINLQAIAYEQGGVTTPLEQRPKFRFVEKVTSGLADPTGRPAPATSK